MSTLSGKRKLDTTESTFDPNLDIATVVFSHVQCVKTRLNLALVSKVWRDASKTAAAYPLRFDLDAFPESWCHREDGNIRYMRRTYLIINMMDNDEALSLPYKRVVGLLGEAAEDVSEYAACRGSVRLLKWARENNRDWSAHTCSLAAMYGQLPALKFLHENGCPWDYRTCQSAAEEKRWDCLQYLVDNKCPGWEIYPKNYAEIYPPNYGGSTGLVRRLRRLALAEEGATMRGGGRRRGRDRGGWPGWQILPKNYAKRLR